MFNRLGELLTEDRYQLPQGPACRICEWGGGGVDSSGAQAQLMAGQNQSINALREMYNQARGDVAPWREAGTAGVRQIGGLLNLPGYTAVDPTATLLATPGYQFLQDQGTQALARYGAASGLGLSGAAARGAQDYGQKLAQTYAWQPYMSSLTNLSGQGLNAGGMSGNWAMQTGSNMANVYGNTSNQLANLQMQQQLYDAQNNPWNDIMGGVGFLGSMALAPFTGGTSLIGAGMSGLSSLFNGGGSGLSNVMDSSGGSWLGAGTFMANGGPTEANRPYIIGERGPELFVPDRPGFIIPNHLMDYSSMSDWKMAA